MVIFLPLLLMLLVLSAMRGETNIILLLPMGLMLALGAVFVTIALGDGTRKKDPSIPVLPTNPLSRQLHSALRTKQPERPAPSPSKGWTPPRFAPPRRLRRSASATPGARSARERLP
jgi:hypothetical protein